MGDVGGLAGLAELSYLNLQNTVVTGDVGGLAGLARLSGVMGAAPAASGGEVTCVSTGLPPRKSGPCQVGTVPRHPAHPPRLGRGEQREQQQWEQWEPHRGPEDPPDDNIVPEKTRKRTTFRYVEGPLNGSFSPLLYNPHALGYGAP